MAVSTLLPNAAGSLQEWTNGAGTVPTNINTDDADTTFRTQNATTVRTDYFPVDAIDPNAVVVTNVDVASKARRNAGGTTNHQNKWNINGANPLSGTCTDPTASYTLITSAAVGRPGGGSFVPGDFNGASTGFQTGYGSCNTGVADTTRATYAYTQVTWEAASGGFAYLLAGLLPPLLAVASHGVSWREILDFYAAAFMKCSLDPRKARAWQLHKLTTREEAEVFRFALVRRPVLCL